MLFLDAGFEVIRSAASFFIGATVRRPWRTLADVGANPTATPIVFTGHGLEDREDGPGKARWTPGTKRHLRPGVTARCTDRVEEPTTMMTHRFTEGHLQSGPRPEDRGEPCAVPRSRRIRSGSQPSMGPRSEDRGERPSYRGGGGLAWPCFIGEATARETVEKPFQVGGTILAKTVDTDPSNGATARRPWRTDRHPASSAHVRYKKLRWATARRPWRTSHVGCSPGTLKNPLHRGHGPKTVENVGTPNSHVSDRTHRQASMGPQPEGRGEHLERCRTSLRPLPACPASYAGHGPEDRGERQPFASVHCNATVEASMGPRLSSRGERQMDSCTGSRAQCVAFNGASARRPWRNRSLPPPSGSRGQDAGASMGPRPGKTVEQTLGDVLRRHSDAWCPALQRGFHGPKTVENDGHRLETASVLVQRASMGPRPEDRGEPRPSYRGGNAQRCERLHVGATARRPWRTDRQ